ncbi:MAG: hypothetical protein IPF60_07205 [Betaproteobacteria bacterium]|nr:hypothetical protein [Betaproteobacteria bacterium]MBK7791589.1 hypothetical protein [Betaproteobacteria bacterium]
MPLDIVPNSSSALSTQRRLSVVVLALDLEVELTVNDDLSAKVEEFGSIVLDRQQVSVRDGLTPGVYMTLRQRKTATGFRL